MVEPSNWPPYPVGPQDSVIAVGVVSANYCRLEAILTDLFAIVTKCPPRFASILIPRLPNNVRTDLMRKSLQWSGLSHDECDRIDHFIRAFTILTENRRRLLHSDLVAFGQGETAIIGTNKKGESKMFRTTAGHLRRVADEIMAYVQYGSHLSAKISPRAGDFAYDTLPDKLALPNPVE
jgi:hypothetical protein